MVQPGEVSHEVGRAYQHVLVGALEKAVPGFVASFHVYENPEKTAFKATDGSDFSFDFSGTYENSISRSEVFGECKGYSVGTGLLDDYREFLAKAFVTSRDNPRHAKDLFWFVTNVPFGCSEGRQIVQPDFVQKALVDSSNEKVRKIVGAGNVDQYAIQSLCARLGAFILTDSFLSKTPICYRVRRGENLWSILKLIHGGRIPPDFRVVTGIIAQQNGLPSADHVEVGQVLRLPWFGVR